MNKECGFMTLLTRYPTAQHSLVLAMSLMLTACMSAPAPKPAVPLKPAPAPTTLTAAVLSKTSPEARLQISTAITQLLRGRGVKIAEDAFTRSSQLTVERHAPNPAARPGLNGRIMTAPVIHRFALAKHYHRCFLVYEKTGQKYLLNGVSCQAKA